MDSEKKELKVLPTEVVTMGDFNDLAQGMVDNLHIAHGGEDGSSGACLLARAMNPLVDKLISALCPDVYVERPRDIDRSLIVPPHLVVELFELKAEMYDPHMAAAS